MDIALEISSRNLWIWQCALVKWKDPFAWGRRNGACNIVYTGEKTYVVRLQRDSIRCCTNVGELSEEQFLPSKQVACRAVFRATVSMPSHILWFGLCASMDRKHSQHLIVSPLCPSLPPSPKGKEAERGQSVLLIPIAWESICGWLLCEKCNEEMTVCILPRTCCSNESLVNCSEVFNIKFSFSLLGYMQNYTQKISSL